MKTTQTDILSAGEQGPAGPAGPQGPAGPPASVAAATVLAAIQAMDAAQITALFTALGIQTLAGLEAANPALGIGDVFRDSTDANKLKSATE